VEKIELEKEYFQVAKKLERQYRHLQFEDHCYWRIALDNTLKAKWDDIIERPAYKNLPDSLFETVIKRLHSYLKDEELLLMHNEKSLAYRRFSDLSDN
jgi:hypothetical protein